ncbi:MAG TPA: GNAT family N-acetyltransferase [Ardenticatenaceae bacterium]|nr:GNAT family N-acetyltransferase [Ardenticatenaceae bacterium]
MNVSDPLVVIRPARQDDLVQVFDIDHEAFSPYGTAETPDIIAKRWEVFPEGFIVVERDGVILGYGSSEKWLHQREPSLNEDPSQTHSPLGRIFCITAMAVRRYSWNQGFGSSILERLICIARRHECKQVILETTHAQQFYLHRGFRIIKERRQWDATLAVLQLIL